MKGISIVVCLWLTVRSVMGLYQVEQVIDYSGVYDSKVLLSENGSKLVSACTNGSVIIRRLINGRYSYLQSFYEAQTIKEIDISPDELKIFVGRATTCQIYTYDSPNSRYLISKNFSISTSQYIAITPDFMHIFRTDSNPVIQHLFFDGNNFISVQNLTEMSDTILDIDTTSDSTYMICGGLQQKARVYEKTGTNFNLISTTNTNMTILQILISDDLQTLYIGGSGSGEIFNYNFGSTDYEYSSSISTPSTMNAMSVRSSPLTLIFGGSSIYIFRQNNSNIQIFQNYSSIEHTMMASSLDQTAKIFALSTTSKTVIFYECLISNCQNCSISICSTCDTGYTLTAGQCSSLNNSSSNTTASNTTENSNTTNTSILEPQQIPTISECSNSQNSVCDQQQCDNNCTQCPQNKQTCQYCIKMYEKNEYGVCEIVDERVKMGMATFSVLTMIRTYKAKSLMLFADDIWLYQYHKPDYLEMPKVVFDITRILQTKKDELVNPQSISFIKSFSNSLKNYEELTNQKFLQLEQSDDSLLRNILNFAFQIVPFTLLFFIIVRILFKKLFNYPISIYLRAISFAGFLFVSLIEGNIEYFVFLGMRNINYLFAEHFNDKIESILILLFLYPSIIYSFGSYFLLRYFYKKNIKYFLDNLYRIAGSSWLMLLFYCIRPFCRGIVHSLLYEHNELQLFLLTLIDLFIFFIFSAFQMINGIHKSSITFCSMGIYLLTGVPLNTYLWMSANDFEQIFISVTDECIQIIFFTRVSCLILGFISKLIEFFSFRKDAIEQIQDIDKEGQSVQIFHPQISNKQIEQVKKQQKLSRFAVEKQPIETPQKKEKKKEKQRKPILKKKKKEKKEKKEPEKVLNKTMREQIVIEQIVFI